MKDGIKYITCDRAGCSVLVGAQRYEGGKVVEEEYIPEYIHTEEGNFCCKDCQKNKDLFMVPNDWQDGVLTEVDDEYFSNGY